MLTTGALIVIALIAALALALLASLLAWWVKWRVNMLEVFIVIVFLAAVVMWVAVE